MATLMLTLINALLVICNLLILGGMIKVYTEIVKGHKIDKIGKV